MGRDLDSILDKIKGGVENIINDIKDYQEKYYIDIKNYVNNIEGYLERYYKRVKNIIKDYKYSLAILSTGRILDASTTFYGLNSGTGKEYNPFSAYIFNTLGYKVVIPMSLLEILVIFSLGYTIDWLMKKRYGVKTDLGKYLISGVGLSSIAVAIQNLSQIFYGEGLNISNNYLLSVLPYLSIYALLSVYGGIKTIKEVNKYKNKK